MSSEQPEVETQTAPAVAAQADITQQMTTPTPTQRVKNPKRVAAGKMVAERTRIAREQQKKAAAEASVIIANNNAKATAAAPEPAPLTEKNSGLSVNQWIGFGGIVVGLAGIYYKREELKAAFKKNQPEPAPASVEPEPQRKGLKKWVKPLHMVYITMMKVDVLQVFISTSAIVGIGLLWINFNEKVFKTVRRLAAAPFSWKKKKDDSSSDCSDQEEEG